MGLNKEDKQFLKELQHQMLTQDTVGQANPRFWVVRHKVRQYGIEDGCDIDGEEVIYNYETIAGNLKELCEYLRDNEDDLEIEYHEGTMEYVTIVKDDYEEDFYDIKELLDYMIEECKRHIEFNGYHYNEPHPYAMTAWRSPQVKRLYEILVNTNWDN